MVKKILAILIAGLMMLSMAACDLGNTEDPNKGNPGTSQSGNQGDAENQDSEETASDEIMVKSISRGYDTNGNYAYVVISFARPNKETITFAHPDGSAITLGNSYVLPNGFDCFSLTDGFEVIGVTVNEKSVTVDYTATYEEFNQTTPSITYTPSSDPLIKTTSGETVDGFTYEAGYTNFELY